MMWLWMACALFGEKPVPPVVPEPVTQLNSVDFGAVESEIRDLYADMDNVDGKDRMLLLQDLIRAVRFAEPEVQQAVYYYIQESLRIERRSLPMMIGTLDLSMESVASEEITIDLNEIVNMLEAGQAESALLLLQECHSTDPACEEMWIKAIDIQVQEIRERESTALESAMLLPAGTERQLAIDKIISSLEDILERYPTTTVGADIRLDITRLRSINEETPSP